MWGFSFVCVVFDALCLLHGGVNGKHGCGRELPLFFIFCVRFVHSLSVKGQYVRCLGMLCVWGVVFLWWETCCNVYRLTTLLSIL